MLTYPDISPEIVRIGPVAIRWYGLMYAIGFGASYMLVRRDLREAGGAISGRTVGAELLSSLFTWLIAGLLLGARLGYVLFYDLHAYLERPAEILAIWHGGMSFHGGLLGAVLAGVLFCRKHGLPPLAVADLIVPTTPIGLGFGRLGNFINGELFGRVTDVPWAMVFPNGGPLPRHPSQLYELFLEGVLLFILLRRFRSTARSSRTGLLTAMFLLLYGSFRGIAEFFREPDPQLGFVAGPFTMGQVLSATMVLAGAVLAARSLRHRE